MLVHSGLAGQTMIVLIMWLVTAQKYTQFVLFGTPYDKLSKIIFLSAF